MTNEAIAFGIASLTANSPSISEKEFKNLQHRKGKTKTERNQGWKALLKERYGVEVTLELVEKDEADLRRSIWREGERERVYQFIEPKDGRDLVYSRS